MDLLTPPERYRHLRVTRAADRPHGPEPMSGAVVDASVRLPLDLAVWLLDRYDTTRLATAVRRAALDLRATAAELGTE